MRGDLEELYAYALLLIVGFPVERAYSRCVDTLFQEDPENDLLTALIWEKNIKNAVSHVQGVIDPVRLDRERLGKSLMALLKREYLACTNYEQFARNAYSVWTLLPYEIGKEDPLFYLCYADDPLGYDDEKGSREICEEAFNFYQ